MSVFSGHVSISKLLNEFTSHNKYYNKQDHIHVDHPLEIYPRGKNNFEISYDYCLHHS